MAPDWEFWLGPGAQALRVVSDDKSLVVHYHLGQPDETRHVTVIRGEVGSSPARPAHQRFRCPRWEGEDGVVGPGTVRALLDWIAEPVERTEVNYGGAPIRERDPVEDQVEAVAPQPAAGVRRFVIALTAPDRLSVLRSPPVTPDDEAVFLTLYLAQGHVSGIDLDLYPLEQWNLLPAPGDIRLPASEEVSELPMRVQHVAGDRRVFADSDLRTIAFTYGQQIRGASLGDVLDELAGSCRCFRVGESAVLGVDDRGRLTCVVIQNAWTTLTGVGPENRVEFDDSAETRAFCNAYRGLLAAVIHRDAQQVAGRERETRRYARAMVGRVAESVHRQAEETIEWVMDEWVRRGAEPG